MTDTYDVVIIGSGPAGYVAAIRCAQLGLKTACIDKRMELGGTCLNVGCIPSKTLLYATEMLYKMEKDGALMGIKTPGISADFPGMMKRKRDVVSSLNAGIKGLFKKNKVTHITGAASFLSPDTLSVSQGPTSQTLKARSMILATGSEPTPLPFLPFDERIVISSTGALQLDKVPKKLVVIGAGVIGVELGSVYSRLGSKVSFVEFADRICPALDHEVSKGFQDILIKQGMEFHLSCKVKAVDIEGQAAHVRVARSDESTFSLEADVVLVSVGRRPFTQGLGLDKVGIDLCQRGLVPVDDQFRTKVSHIYAVGDIIDGPMLAHKASEEGVCVAEGIAGLCPALDYISIPSIVYAHPEIASVGFSEEEAKKKGFEVKIGHYSFKSNPRAKCTLEEDGFVKVIADDKTDKLLGVHIMSAHASEMITAAVFAIEKRMTSLDLAHLCFPHPTLSEAIKEAALSIHKKAIHK